MIGLTRRRLLVLTAGVASGLAGCGAGPSGDETQTESSTPESSATTVSQTTVLTATAEVTPTPAATTTSPPARETTTARGETPDGTSDPIPTSEASTQPTTATGEMDAATFRRAMRARLLANDIRVESFERVDGAWRLVYSTTKTTEEGVAAEARRIVLEYAELLEEYNGDEPLEATVLGSGGATLGSWSVRAEWARQYNDGEITERELLERVYGTVETR